MKKPKILVVGSIMRDLILKTPRMPKEGESYIGEGYSYANGGKGANQAVSVARLGADVAFCGKMGDDENGISLKNALIKEGINTKYLFSTDKSYTGLATIILEDGGKNRIIVNPGANMLLCKEETEKALEDEYDALIIQLETPDESIIEVCNKAYEKNIPVFLDAGPAREFPIEKIKAMEVLSPNETEIYALTGIKADTIENYEIACKKLAKMSNSKYIVLKLGSKGAMLYDGSACEMYPAMKVNAVDTTAAGDCFTAAMTYKYLLCNDIRLAIKYANIVASISVTRLGAQPSLPYLEEVEKVIS